VLAEKLAGAVASPTVFVTSSGFLVGKPGSDDHASAHRLASTGYGVTLLPSLDIDVATSIVVARQLTRGFGFEQASEERKFRERFHIYRDTGEMLVVSVGDPPAVAAAMVDRLTS
jgi:shikimate kinase